MYLKRKRKLIEKLEKERDSSFVHQLMGRLKIKKEESTIKICGTGVRKGRSLEQDTKSQTDTHTHHFCPDLWILNYLIFW